MIEKENAEKQLREKGYDCELKDGVIIFKGISMAAARKAVKDVGYSASFGVTGGMGEKRKDKNSGPEQEFAEEIPGMTDKKGVVSEDTDSVTENIGGNVVGKEGQHVGYIIFN